MHYACVCVSLFLSLSLSRSLTHSIVQSAAQTFAQHQQTPLILMIYGRRCRWGLNHEGSTACSVATCVGHSTAAITYHHLQVC